MALLTFKSPEFTFKQKLILEERYLSRVIWTSNFPRPTRCKASYKVETIPRRSSKFQPSIWTNDYIQSLSSEYKEEMYREQCKVLSEEVRMMLCKVKNEIDQLEFIDVLQRLGVAYHFNNEIRNILDNIYNTQTSNLKNNLYATSLKFRLLRQHRYNISTDVFIDFQDEMCNFKKEQPIDVEAMLSMYEASFHSFANETILDELRDVTSKFLKEYLKNGGNHISLLISHALELPLHWRIPRWEAWWFINICERQQNQNHVLLQFAKLDFNIVQSIYQEELKYTSRWWKRTELGEKLSFSRDRLVENFVWTMGTNFKPEFEYFRKVITKVNSFITTIDDVYDVYGTLEELELFTHTIERWDLSAMNSLPYYMKICFLALYNFVNELAFEILKKSGYYIIPYLKKVREIETGDIPKSIQCYMNESGVSEVEACDYIKSMICTMWKKMNKEAHTSSFSQSFIDTCINHARMAMFMYEHGDGHSIQDLEIQNRITSLALQPIPFICTKNSELNNDI
ncbi:myrcene synthase, chloroplastic-like isoform X2 [Cicer arietinum]|uniref:Myrcene synthase, chloroplastic-like isoform X3 n=1 Tax=Cicer arietinum TaxID=3827 RepID=A0A1S2XIM6_CICAR|nr:myrcene synthase, chloroplastic-like isoform X3 [Cicer arietinum]